MMRIAYFSSRFPEPYSTAAGWRSERIIHTCQEQAEVILCASGGTTASELFWKEQGFTTQLLSPNENSNEEQIHSLAVEVVIFDRFFMEEQFGWLFQKMLPDCRRLIDTQDLHAVRIHREKQWKQNRAPELSLPTLKDPLLQRELSSILRSDKSLIISEKEYQFLLSLGVPPEKLLYLPLCIQISDTKNTFSDKKDFVWLGSFRHEPNCQSFRWLQEGLWKKIRAHVPEANLHLYGSYPPAWVMQAHRPTDGFHVHGECPDPRAVFSNARVSLAPLPYGAGLKGKILESLSQHTPVVTNEVGAEGYSFLDSFTTRTEDEFVEEAVKLYTDETIWSRQLQIAHAEMRKSYCPEKNQTTWSDFLRQITSTPRAPDLWHSILWNQSHRASEYMARWITEKNSS